MIGRWKPLIKLNGLNSIEAISVAKALNGSAKLLHNVRMDQLLTDGKDVSSLVRPFVIYGKPKKSGMVEVADGNILYRFKPLVEDPAAAYIVNDLSAIEFSKESKDSVLITLRRGEATVGEIIQDGFHGPVDKDGIPYEESMYYWSGEGSEPSDRRLRRVGENSALLFRESKKNSEARYVFANKPISETQGALFEVSDARILIENGEQLLASLGELGERVWNNVNEELKRLEIRVI